MFEELTEDGGLARTIGTVKYRFSAQEKTLSRFLWRYPSTEEDAAGEVIAADVEGLQFQYLEGVAGDVDAWRGTWVDSTNHPAAVRIDMRTTNSIQGLMMTRDIPLVEGLWQQE
jgi:hypothetical protein